MYLLDFMNAHKENWQELLAAKPFFFSIKCDEPYYIVKYNMILSDFSNPISLEARGSIFRFDNDKDEWICVCHPFDKFFNYGEQYSAVSCIDWSTASVQQKIDGSLIKIWYDFGEWHISTNGTIDAYKAECGPTTYGMIVDELTKKMLGFWDELDPHYCYMFELTSKWNHIVVHYDMDALWYLGKRNMRTHKEDREILEVENLRYPMQFRHTTLAECVAAAHEMGVDEEGYVVCDANFNRIKVKGDEYLILHKLRGNGALTTLRVIELWQQDSLDDFSAYYPEFNNFIADIMNEVGQLIVEGNNSYFAISNSLEVQSRAQFAALATSHNNPVTPFLFAKYDNKCANATEFFKSFRARNLASYINSKITIKSIGVEEDA